MSDHDFMLGPVPRLLNYLLLLIITIAAAWSFHAPPRHRILLWPHASFLIYLACVEPLKVLLSSLHDQNQEILEATVAAAMVALAMVLIRRPNRILYAVGALFMGFSVARYALVFMRACPGCTLVGLLPLLKHPFWIDTLASQLAALLAAATMGWLAVWRSDVFVKA